MSDLVGAFVGLSDGLAADYDESSVFERLVVTCVDLVDLAAAMVVLVRPDGDLAVAASSDDVLAVLSRNQVERHGGRVQPTLSAAGRRLGLASLQPVPLHAGSQSIGTLHLFAVGHGPLASCERKVVQALADVATRTVVQQRLAAQATVLNTQLKNALDSRVVLEQATGVIAEFGDLDMGAAFAAMRTYARSRGVRLNAVARQLVRRELSASVILRPTAASRR